MAGERGRTQRPFSCQGKNLGKIMAVVFSFQGAAGAMLKLVKVVALALKASAAGHPSLRRQIAIPVIAAPSDERHPRHLSRK